ncbi:MAG: hypothetical protein CMN28_11130 [Salinisphaeraceae bacterium]|nr:hypothetical protein [Salinisphaeraceae bacterium]
MSGDEFDRVFGNLANARRFGKGVHQTRVLGLAQKLMQDRAGLAFLFEYAPRFAEAGVFAGGDWANPASLQPALVRNALLGGGPSAAIECLSELRFLAVAQGSTEEPGLDAPAAQKFLEDVLARNLDLVFPESSEATRETGGLAYERACSLLGFVADHLDTSNILAALISEAERVLLQRPIMVERIETMLRTATRSLPPRPAQGGEDDPAMASAWALLAALDGPTDLARAHSEPAAFEQALEALDDNALLEQARCFGASMDRTGLVCRLHAVLLRHAMDRDMTLLAEALALSRVGRTSLEEYAELVRLLIEHAVTVDTARCIYGLSRLLNHGILFFRPVAPGLQRLTVLPIQPPVAELLQTASRLENPPAANTLLLAGTLSVLGQPRGVDQGNNPTCQAARAISLWSQNDMGYLLELICRAARDGEIIMHFEGQAIRSSELSFGLAKTLNTELDPVSLVLTPHLDRIYMEMSRRTIGRGEDGHRWVNPELHGWWVYRRFSSLIDPQTGGIRDHDGFMRLLYAVYHPLYNGGREMVYAQPCGVVSTDANGTFIGWHAVSIQRVALDPDGQWRVYFFNPNRDKGQSWGQGIRTSTCDHGEFEGESSLPFEQFAMRLYVFHYKLHEVGDPDAVPAEFIQTIRETIAAGWGHGRAWS